jgi:cytochrome c
MLDHPGPSRLLARMLLALVLIAAAPGAALAQMGYGPGPGSGTMGPGMMGQGMMGQGMMGQGMMGQGMMGQGMMPGMMGRGASQAAPGTAGGSSVFGAQIFAGQCAMCHSLQANAPSGVGPDLHGLFGRRAGTAPGYSYSPAMRRSGIVWNARSLDAFLAAPQSLVPGTRMAFAGIADAAERRALIAYLRAASR